MLSHVFSSHVRLHSPMTICTACGPLQVGWRRYFVRPSVPAVDSQERLEWILKASVVGALGHEDHVARFTDQLFAVLNDAGHQ